MKRYAVGNVYTFEAEDEDHAIEQYLDLLVDVDIDANFLMEVEND